MRSTIDRFIAKVGWPSAATACWPWKAATDRHGYGSFRFQGEKRLAHRASYELFRGPIPDGLHIDHLCRVRACVNPLHLEAVPMIVNTMRGQSRQAINARKTHCPKGHAYDEQNTYRYVRGGRSQRYCRACNASAARSYQARKKQVTS